jgi:hypothetical protein
MPASAEEASPYLPRRMSSKACLTAPRSGLEGALGAGGGVESFEWSAAGVGVADSVRAIKVGRGRGRGMDFGLARETVASASQASAVAKVSAEAAAVRGNFIGFGSAGNRACRIGDSKAFGKGPNLRFLRPLGRIGRDLGLRPQSRGKSADFGSELSLATLPADHVRPV